jgi:hypothetical protein
MYYPLVPGRKSEGAMVLYQHPFECPLVDHNWSDRIIVRPAPVLPGVELLGSCWIWCGWNNAKPYNKDGRGGPYGKVKIAGRTDYLHRVMWERYNGLLLQGGEVIDHRCRVRLCFSPHHIECVDHEENAQRRSDYAASFKEVEYDPDLHDLNNWS